jgi:hypothetical protein
MADPILEALYGGRQDRLAANPYIRGGLALQDARVPISNDFSAGQNFLLQALKGFGSGALLGLGQKQVRKEESERGRKFAEIQAQYAGQPDLIVQALSQDPSLAAAAPIYQQQAQAREQKLADEQRKFSRGLQGSLLKEGIVLGPDGSMQEHPDFARIKKARADRQAIVQQAAFPAGLDEETKKIVSIVPESLQRKAFEEKGTIENLQGALGRIDELMQLGFDNRAGKLDPTGLSPASKNYNTVGSALASLIQANWKGPMSDPEAERIVKPLLPSASDSVDTLRTKAQTLKQQLVNNSKPTPILSGYGIAARPNVSLTNKPEATQEAKPVEAGEAKAPALSRAPLGMTRSQFKEWYRSQQNAR